MAIAQATLLYVVPIVLLAITDTWWATLLLWVAAGLGIAGLFVLGHDASHGALFRSRRANRVVAWACMVPSAHVEAAWNLGHNRVHHGYTTRQGFDFVWHPTTPDEYRDMSTMERLRHRLEWSLLGSGAYYLRVVWFMWMREAPADDTHVSVYAPLSMRSALMVAACIILFLGIFPSAFGFLDFVQSSVDALASGGSVLAQLIP